MLTLTNERGWWINTDDILITGDVIDAHTLYEDGSFVVTRNAEVIKFFDDTDEYGYAVVSTDKGDFSYYNSSIFLINEED